jgi:PEP-CTERM motif
MKSIDRNMLPVCRKAPLGLKLFLAVLVLSVLGSTAARADIIGDTVVIQYLFPDSSTQFGLSATGVVTSTGVTLNLFSNQSITVFGGDVQMVGVRDPSSSFVGATFNGVSIQDLTNPSAFTTFSIDPATTIPGFGLSDVSIQGGLLFINYEGLTTPLGSLAQVDFTGGNSTVPEPSTITLLLLGSGALSTLLRRRGAVR